MFKQDEYRILLNKDCIDVNLVPNASVWPWTITNKLHSLSVTASLLQVHQTGNVF